MIPRKYYKFESILKTYRDALVHKYKVHCNTETFCKYNKNLFKIKDLDSIFSKSWDALVRGSLDTSYYGSYDEGDYSYKTPSFYAIQDLLYDLNVVLNSFYIGNSEYSMIINILGKKHYENTDSIKNLIFEEILK